MKVTCTIPRSSRRCCRGNSRREVTDMKRAARAPWRRVGARFILGAAALLVALPLLAAALAEEGMTNPFLGKPEAISAGRDVYQRKCLVCHQSAGARGPNLFAT